MSLELPDGLSQSYFPGKSILLNIAERSEAFPPFVIGFFSELFVALRIEQSASESELEICSLEYLSCRDAVNEICYEICPRVH